MIGIGLLLTNIAIAVGQAGDLVQIPSGSVEAIWLSPVAKSNIRKGPSQTRKYVRGFKAQKTAVTKGDFVEFLRENPQWDKNSISAIYADESYLKNLSQSNSKAPITYVSWFAARAYCKWKGLRLPSVNEWEYMAAASEKKYDANRDSQFLQRILNWYGEPQGGELKTVGSIYKNIYGLWDMHGLIWEWVEDFNSNFVTGESREDGSFNKDMFCGAGSMSSADKENYAAFMRFAFRSGLRGTSSVWNLGFRCVQ